MSTKYIRFFLLTCDPDESFRIYLTKPVLRLGITKSGPDYIQHTVVEGVVFEL